MSGHLIQRLEAHETAAADMQVGFMLGLVCARVVCGDERAPDPAARGARDGRRRHAGALGFGVGLCGEVPLAHLVPPRPDLVLPWRNATVP